MIFMLSIIIKLNFFEGEKSHSNFYHKFTTFFPMNKNKFRKIKNAQVLNQVNFFFYVLLKDDNVFMISNI